jgi:hypothetical protein
MRTARAALRKELTMCKASKTTARGRGDWQGMNWIRQTSRLAIYLRDGLSCCYCGSSIEDGVQLTLDHLKPHSRGGKNKPENLVTCCAKCNSSRGNRPVAEFCRAVAEYIDDDASVIERHVRNCARRSMAEARAMAKKMIARRGSAARALAEMQD